MNKILIVGRDYSVEDIFQKRGWEVGVYLGGKPEFDPDFVLFTGGADISPHLYGEENTDSWCNEARDNFEVETYHQFKSAKKLGICRGMQLLNIMNGGKMVQDIRGHGGGRHEVYDFDAAKPYVTNSCHHQMVVPSDEVKVVGVSKYSGGDCPEVIWIESDQALGIQGHPEWEKPTEDYFFELIKRYFDVA